MDGCLKRHWNMFLRINRSLLSTNWQIMSSNVLATSLYPSPFTASFPLLTKMMGRNANHVIQRCLERVPSDKLQFVIDACRGQVYNLATHPYGCRVLQRIFENCPPEQVRGLLDELHRYTQNLVSLELMYWCEWSLMRGIWF
jgi:hypothetical protein